MSDFIEIYPHALDTATCRKIIEFFEHSPAKIPSGTGVTGVLRAAR
jgi:hypothetical protein